MNILSDLKQRLVFRVAVIYIAAAFIITEASVAIFRELAVPERTVTLLIVALILGFPIAMVLAWFFDAGPDNRKRSSQGGLASGAILVLAWLALALLLDPLDRRYDWDDRPRISAADSSMSTC